MTTQRELAVLARQAVLGEIKFRMDKLWRIFSWTSTVLVAITGGTIVLRAENELSLGHRSVIAGAAIVLALYAVLWLSQNLRLEGQARDALAAHDEALGVASYNDAIGGVLPRPDVGILIGYNLTVLLLALAAVIAAFVAGP